MCPKTSAIGAKNHEFQLEVHVLRTLNKSMITVLNTCIGSSISKLWLPMHTLEVKSHECSWGPMHLSEPSLNNDRLLIQTLEAKNLDS